MRDQLLNTIYYVLLVVWKEMLDLDLVWCGGEAIVLSESYDHNPQQFTLRQYFILNSLKSLSFLKGVMSFCI